MLGTPPEVLAVREAIAAAQLGEQEFWKTRVLRAVVAFVHAKSRRQMQRGVYTWATRYSLGRVRWARGVAFVHAACTRMRKYATVGLGLAQPCHQQPATSPTRSTTRTS